MVWILFKFKKKLRKSSKNFIVGYISDIAYLDILIFIVGLDSSVGRAPARQSGGRRFKSRSSQISLFIQIYLF